VLSRLSNDDFPIYAFAPAVGVSMHWNLFAWSW
jgi:hypothetical protein